MPGQDQYYQGLAKQTRTDGFSKQSQNTTSFTPTSSISNNGYSQAQPGGSPYDAGSGFVNLSHLLSLNGASGQQSANMAASNVATQGAKAQGAIQGATDNYNKAVSAGQVNSDQYTKYNDPHSQDADAKANPGLVQGKPAQLVKNALDKANGGYTGPSSLQDQPGYANLSKQVSSAQSRAQNATNGAGEAGQIAQDTGLSPRQAAASAFYQGVTNRNLASAGNKYKGLGDMLDKANANSVKASDLARQTTYDSIGPLSDQYKQLMQNANNPYVPPPVIDPGTGYPEGTGVQPAGWVDHSDDENTNPRGHYK